MLYDETVFFLHVSSLLSCIIDFLLAFSGVSNMDGALISSAFLLFILQLPLMNLATAMVSQLILLPSIIETTVEATEYGNRQIKWLETRQTAREVSFSNDKYHKEIAGVESLSTSYLKRTGACFFFAVNIK